MKYHKKNEISKYMKYQKKVYVYQEKQSNIYVPTFTSTHVRELFFLCPAEKNTNKGAGISRRGLLKLVLNKKKGANSWLARIVSNRPVFRQICERFA